MESLSQLKSESHRMMACLNQNPEFLPSKFWNKINAKNFSMLEQMGLENFKRSVSLNYYNWLITASQHPQVQFLRSQFPLLQKLLRILVQCENPMLVQTYLADEPFLLDKKQRRIYAELVALVWLQMKHFDKHRLAEKVSEPDLGNPMRVFWRLPFFRSKFLSQDLSNSVIECNTIIDLIHEQKNTLPRVAELGAGFGRLAHIYAESKQPGTYFVFDIPPALPLAQAYLTAILPDVKIARFRNYQNFEEIEKAIAGCKLVFCTSNQLPLFPDRYFDIVTSISTLPEMTPEQVVLFTNQFERLSDKFIFLKQWLDDWKNPEDGTLMRKDDYYFHSEDWKLEIDRIDPTNPQFFNRVWRRQ